MVLSSLATRPPPKIITNLTTFLTILMIFTNILIKIYQKNDRISCRHAISNKTGVKKLRRQIKSQHLLYKKNKINSPRVSWKTGVTSLLNVFLLKKKNNIFIIMKARLISGAVIYQAHIQFLLVNPSSNKKKTNEQPKVLLNESWLMLITYFTVNWNSATNWIQFRKN